MVVDDGSAEPVKEKGFVFMDTPGKLPIVFLAGADPAKQELYALEEDGTPGGAAHRLGKRPMGEKEIEGLHNFLDNHSLTGLWHKVGRWVRQMSGRPPMSGIHPDHAVALPNEEETFFFSRRVILDAQGIAQQECRRQKRIGVSRCQVKLVDHRRKPLECR